MSTVLAFVGLGALVFLMLGLLGWVINSLVAVVAATGYTIAATGERGAGLALLFVAVLSLASAVSLTLLDAWGIYHLLTFLDLIH